MKTLGLVVALLFATAGAAADEVYVPLASRTEVQIVNVSEQRTSVAIDVLGEKSSRWELDAGEHVEWIDERRDPGIVRIRGDVQVTAVHRRADASASAPVVRATQTAEEATARTSDTWRSGLVIVNPGDTMAMVTVDGTMHALAPDGVLHGKTFQADTPLLVFGWDANDATGAYVFTPHATPRKRRAVRSATPAPQVQTVTLTPSKDNTLYETTDGSLSNGVGPHIFAGMTRRQSKRRALLAFNVASQVPPGSRITRVRLTMNVSMTISGAEPATLHRVTADWGEGASNAGTAGDGVGAASRPGDATWLHTFFPDRRWSTAGGDFQADADATTQVASATSVWESAGMTARVQQWLDQPAANFGWIVIGNEARSGSAKRFDSREASTSRPSLTIEFQR